MADSYYQIATTPKLYVSYPLWQYANGALDSYRLESYEGSEYESQKLLKLLQLNPSEVQDFHLDIYNQFDYRILPSYDDFTDVVDTGIWNFDFACILGHNLASRGIQPRISSRQSYETSGDYITTTNIVNHTPNGSPEYDGWSLMGLEDLGNNDDYIFQYEFLPTANAYIDYNIGSLMFGKSYEFPQNTNLSTATSYSYGIKQKKSISGKTISTANYTKPNNWTTEPFGLGYEFGDNFQRRSGIRSWKIQFDSLSPDKVMNQNQMMNDNGYIKQDNHSVYGADNNSLYNINNSPDFYSRVIHKTMASHLPMIFQINKDDNSPSNFALVRIKENSYTITQKSPNLYNIALTLIEQV